MAWMAEAKGPLPTMWTTSVIFLIGMSLTVVAADSKEDESEFVALTLLDSDLGKFGEEFYREYDPALGVEDNAAAAFQHFGSKAHLDDELTSEEKEAFQKRVVDELVLELDNDNWGGKSQAEKDQIWKKDLKTALDDQKPCATKKQWEALAAKDPTGYKYDAWMAGMSCNDVTQITGLVLNKADKSRMDKAFDEKKISVWETPNNPDDVYDGKGESLLEESSNLVSMLERVFDNVNRTLHPEEKRLHEIEEEEKRSHEAEDSEKAQESLVDEGESASFNLTSTFDPTKKWPQCKEVLLHVRNQGKCGSCWAQAVAGVVESQLCIKSNGKFKGNAGWISAGYIASCGNNGRDGCRGGNPGGGMAYQARSGTPTGGNGDNLGTCVPYFGTGNSLDHFNGGGRSPPCPSQCSKSGGRTRYSRQLSQDKFYGPPTSYRDRKSVV